jgi:hypothetical protein
MQPNLIHELSHHQYFRDKLQEEFPDADEETLRDTLEGMTNLTDMLGAVLRSQLDDLDLTAALRARIADMQERLALIYARCYKKRELLTSTMGRAVISKITEADFTVSLRPKPPPLVLVDEKEIPEDFWKPQPAKLDRQGLIAALKTGRDVPGATLGNSALTISVRTK